MVVEKAAYLMIVEIIHQSISRQKDGMERSPVWIS